MTQALPVAVRLRLDFDAARLRADLDRIDEDEWIAHFNPENYEGSWAGVPLQGPAGAEHPILALAANPGTEEWAPTEYLERCPYFSEVVAAFHCRLMSVRLLRLGPGSRIKEHSDLFADTEVRIHVPVTTNPKVETLVAGQSVEMSAGETWYLDVSRPHRIDNRGATDRVHIVLDCELNDWLRGQMVAETSP